MLGSRSCTTAHLGYNHLGPIRFDHVLLELSALQTHLEHGQHGRPGAQEHLRHAEVSAGTEEHESEFGKEDQVFHSALEERETFALTQA